MAMEWLKHLYFSGIGGKIKTEKRKKKNKKIL